MNKTKKVLLAAITCSAALAGAFGLAACNTGDGGGGESGKHNHNYVDWQSVDAENHMGTCNAAGDCDAKTKTEEHDTDGEDGACSKCGYEADDEDDGKERTATVSVGVDKTFDSLDETGLTLTLEGAEEGKSYTLSSTDDKVVFQAGISHGNPVTFVYHEKGEGVTVSATEGTLSNVTIKLEETEEEEKEFTTIAVNDVVTVTGASYSAPKKYEIQLAAGKYQIFVVGDTAEEVTALDAAAPFGIGAGYDEDGYLIPLVTLAGDENTVEVDEGKYYVDAYEDVIFKVAVASVHTHVWRWEVTKQPTDDETGTAAKAECLGAVGTCDGVSDGSTVELPTLDSERYFVGDDSASCLSGGIQQYSIMIDGNAVSFYVETPALEHTEQILEAKEATCSETGLTEGKKCSVCHTVLEEQEVIEAKGHSFAATEPTVNETAKTVSQRCTVCNKSVVYKYDNLVNATSTLIGSPDTLSDGVNYVIQSGTKNYLSYTFEEAGTYSIYWVNLKGGKLPLTLATFGSSTAAFIKSGSVQNANIMNGLVFEGYNKGSAYTYYVLDEDDNYVLDESGTNQKATVQPGEYASLKLIKNKVLTSSLSGFSIEKLTFEAAANSTLKLNINDEEARYLICIGKEKTNNEEEINKKPTAFAELCSIGEGNITVKDSEIEFVPVTEQGTYTFTATTGKFELYVNGNLYDDGTKAYFGYVGFCDRYLTVTLQEGDVVKVVKVSGRASDNTFTISEGTLEEPAVLEFTELELGNNTITLSDTNIAIAKYEDGTEQFFAFTADESGYYEISVADDVKVTVVTKVDRTHYPVVLDVDTMNKHSGVFYAEAGETVVIAFTGNNTEEFTVNIAPGEEPVTYLEVNEKLETVTFTSFETFVKLTVGNSVAEGEYNLTFKVNNSLLRSHIYFSVNEEIEVDDVYDSNAVAAYINADRATGANNTVGGGTRSADINKNDFPSDEEWAAHREYVDYTRTVTLKAGDVIYLATDSLVSGYTDITLTPVSE